MDAVKIALFAVVAVVGVVLMRQTKNEFALALTVCAGVLLAISVCDKLFSAVYALYDLTESTGLDSEAIACVVKVVGIGYVGEFSNNICVDANCKSIGDKVLLASKISILFCALPTVQKLFEILGSLVL